MTGEGIPDEADLFGTAVSSVVITLILRQMADVGLPDVRLICIP